VFAVEVGNETGTACAFAANVATIPITATPAAVRYFVILLIFLKVG
jgi:hypothetical protein